MILGPDGAKLSKRHGAVSVLQYEEEGYLPDALLNYLVRLGWSHGDQEVFTREEMIAAFDIHDVNKAASAFNPEKLLWLNQQHMVRASPAALVPHLRAQLRRLGLRQRRSAAARGRDPRAARARQDAQGDGAEQPLLLRRAHRDRSQGGREAPERRCAAACCAKCASGAGRARDWDAAAHPRRARSARDGELQSGLGKIAQPLRVAVTGTAVSPPIDATLALLGRERTLARIDAALKRGASARV